MNSYDIVADAVREYVDMQRKDKRPIDRIYIVHFYQSYNPITDFEECTELVYYNFDDETCDFEMDFCEGQCFVNEISIMSLHEIGDVMGTLFNMIKENRNENK